MLTTKRTYATVGLAALTAVALAGCGGSASGSSAPAASSASTTSAMSSPSSAMSSATSAMSSTSSATNAAADLVGPGCAAYATANPTGPASVEGMSTDPVAVAASNNPLLTTLVKAVTGKLNPKVNLVNTLDSGQFTVFAPVDSAFAKIPASTIDGLKTNTAMLTKILTYHVLPGEIEPASIDGSHTTVEGQKLTVKGSGNTLTVNGAHVICGGVRTANATVYLVDSVLMPPAH